LVEVKFDNELLGWKVVKEDGKWKIRIQKSLEDNPIFGIQEKE